MKARKKIMYIILIILVSISSISIATVDPNNYDPRPSLNSQDYEEVLNMVGTIVGAITSVGTVISVMMVIILGIKYMMGSIEEKAEYKKSMIPMFIGAILLFAGSTIVSIIYRLVEQL